jgi:hypothetical protein
VNSEGKCRSLEVSSANVLQITSEDSKEVMLMAKRDLGNQGCIQIQQGHPPACNTLLRIMYIMLNRVS